VGSELDERERITGSLPDNEEEKELLKAKYFMTAVFEKCFPQYLAMGMTSDEYWNGSSDLTRVYREADEIRRRRRNEELWLQGAYIYDALCAVAPYFRELKPSKPLPYAKEPYPITQKQVREKQEREEKLQYEKAKAMMKRLEEEGKRRKAVLKENGKEG
jgi:hypothetical protein